MEEPEFPFFCHICGTPPTWHGLLADSTLHYLEPEENNFVHNEYGYKDFMPGMGDYGYDARLLPPRKIRWLESVRLVTNKIVNTVKGTETRAPAPFLTSLAVYVNISTGTFHYAGNTKVLRCNVDGYLVHDTCFKMLERVHRHLQSQATTFSSQDLDLGLLWKWLELGLEDRNSDLVDWGFGDAFHDDRLWQGLRFDPDYQEWHPVKGSMWTVLDPESPFDCQPILERASASTQAGYSFTIPATVKLAPADQPAHAHSKPNFDANILSLLPRELQLNILELLPTPSMLNLILASPDFRPCTQHLPSSFWKSRLHLDMPWCADIIHSQIQSLQWNGTEKENQRVHFDRLLRFLKDFYKTPGQEPDGENLEFKGLRNRRRIWLLCERIVKEMQVLRGDGSGSGSGNGVESEIGVEASNLEAEN
ncbi:uncharacterized protein BDV14DRAFT_185602 [Aspergillus stella-maris]|uniref:uncharacterized protein n=1 Tax=Aspergillus stella-maris TaxID=1810926 RepID=UPI003CCCA94A